MAVDAASAVPTAVGLVAVIHLYGDNVVAVGTQPGREFVAETAVSVGTLAQFVTVYIHGGVHIHTVEIDEIAFARLWLQLQLLAIPPYSAGQCAAARSRRVGSGKVALYRPVVRKVEKPPGGIIITVC